MKRSTPAFVAALALAGELLLAPRVARAEFPTLQAAIQKAREHSLVVVEAEGEVGVAAASLTGARVSAFANPYSDVQVDRPFSDGALGERNRETQVMTYNYVPVDIAGQRGKRIDEAKQLIEWKKVGLVHAQAVATGEIANVYGEFVISAARVEAANVGEVTAREEAKFFQGKFEAKDTTLYEKSIAEAEVARWVQQKAEAELRVANVRARYGQLTGEGAPELPGPNTSILVPPLRNTWDDAFISRVVEKTPAVTRLTAEKNYWEASIERYEREKIPPVSFGVIAGRGGQGELRLGGGAIITFPITRRYQGEIRRAEFGRAHAVRHVDLYKNLVATRLRAARDAIAAVSRALEELDKMGIPALERAVTASVEGFRAGKIDLTRAMLARRDLAVARQRRLDLLEASWRAYSDLVVFSGELP